MHIHAQSRVEQSDAMQSLGTTDTASSNSIFERTLRAPSGSEAAPVRHFRAPAGFEGLGSKADPSVCPTLELKFMNRYTYNCIGTYVHIYISLSLYIYIYICVCP